MATVKSDIYLKQNGEQLGNPKAEIGDVNGRIRSLYFSYTFAADVLSIADIVKLGQLPKGARIVGGKFYSDSLGTTGIMTVGWPASADAVEAADTNGIFAAIDAGGQAVVADAVSTDGFGKKFAAKVDVQAVFTEASDGANGDSIKGVIEYVID